MQKDKRKIIFTLVCLALKKFANILLDIDNCSDNRKIFFSLHLRDYLLPYSALSPYQLFEFNFIYTLDFGNVTIYARFS